MTPVRRVEFDCTVAECGDGIVDPGEDCDDENDVNTDACTNACTNARCGDGSSAPAKNAMATHLASRIAQAIRMFVESI